MNKIFLSLACAAFSFTAASQTLADSIRAKFLNPQCNDVLVAVHRGDWRNYAENCIQGIVSTIGMGADIVEIDLWRTSDGELVLMHDPKIDRTTTGKGKISELTLDEIKHVQLRNAVGARTPYLVPTLEEALMAGKDKVLFNLDKAFDYFDQVMEILERTGTTTQVIMKSDAPAKEVKSKYGKHLDKIIYMPIVHIDKPGASEKIAEYIDVLDPPAFELVYRDSTCVAGKEIAPMLEGRSRVWYNSLWASLCGGHDDFASLENPADGWGFLVDSLSCNVIQTDQPARLIEYLKAKHRK